MELLVQNISKKYNNHFLFKDISLSLKPNDSIAIIGQNGKGKTTFLKMLLGYTPVSSGKITLIKNEIESEISNEDVSYCGVSQQVFSELTVNELFDFHFAVRNSINKDLKSLLAKVFPSILLAKQCEKLSAGWLQRVKLLLALNTDTPIVLLDEPFTNLDKQGIELFSGLIKEITKDRILVIASNREDEIALCNQTFELTQNTH